MQTREKIYVRALCHKMHPDLFTLDKLTELEKFVVRSIDDRAKIDERLDFWILVYENEVIPVQDNHWLTTFTTTQSVTQYDGNYNIDVDATVKAFAKVVKFARKYGYGVRKDYQSSTFNLYIKLPSGQEMNFYADRDVICTKVHVGTEVIPATPEKVVDKYDWNCEKVAFLGVETD